MRVWRLCHTRDDAQGDQKTRTLARVALPLTLPTPEMPAMRFGFLVSLPAFVLSLCRFIFAKALADNILTTFLTFLTLVIAARRGTSLLQVLQTGRLSCPMMEKRWFVPDGRC